MPNGTSIALVSGGALMAYAAVTGKSPLQAFFYAVRGTDPRTAAVTQKVDAHAGVAASSALTGGGAAVVAAAQGQLGKPYAWAQPTNPDDPNPKSFDCSGLTQWCYARAGVRLKSHNTITQRHNDGLKLVPLAQAQPGDLVFFGTDLAPHHVGIYVGNDQMINAPDYGIPVRQQSIRQHDLLPTVGQFPGTPAGASTANNSGGARALGQQLAAAKGWTGAEWDALDKLWTRESSWSPKAKNPSSGAYGIPQALPASKLPKAGQEPTSDPAAQIAWGLKYIAGRYGRPSVAWAHELQHGWY